MGTAEMTDRKILNSPPPSGTPKITTIYRATIYENNLKTSRKNFPQVKIQRRNHKTGRRSGNSV